MTSETPVAVAYYDSAGLVTRLTFGVFGSACFFAYLWSTYVVPETANIPLEAIDELFRSPASQDDILLKKQVRWLTSFSALQLFLTVVLARLNENLGYMI